MTTHRQNQTMYTASEIASAAGMSRRWAFKALEGITPSGQVLQGGKPVNAWAFMDLPGDIRARLDAQAQKFCFKDAEQLLDRGKTPWQPEIPLREIADRHIQKAHDLKRALLPILEKLSDLDSLASVEKQGLQLYKEIFGHAVSSRHWNRLIMRTFNRDAGRDEFQRLEIYLDDKLTRRPQDKSKATKAAKDAFIDARAAIDMIANINKPTPKEKLIIWTYVLSAVEELIQGGTPEKAANKAALEFLNAEALFIAKSADALRAAFYRKAKAWKKSGGKPSAIKDRRNERSGNHKPAPLSEEDENTILAYTTIAGGRLSQGWREARRAGALSPELMQRYILNERENKSYVPNPIRAALQHKVKMVDDHHHGPHRAKMQGAFLERDPSSIHSGDWFQGDDTTLPIYIHNEKDPRKPTRGQFLMMVDVRTGFILSYVMIADKAYNGRDVRNLITVTHDRWGLPRKGFYFENGIWRAKTVKGGIAWAETEAGLMSELNLRFQHAREARAKIVERAFGLLQNYCERIQGYVGRDERHDHYEKIQKQLQSVRGGKVPSVEMLLTQEELCQALDWIIDQVNNDVQNGKLCPGLTPEEAYTKYFNFNDPLTQLGRTTRYLLADSVEKVTVGRNGISLLRGKDRFTYKSEETGKRQGMEVLAWFSPENPEILCVTDLKKKNPFTVERAQAVPLMDADPDLLDQENSRNATHNNYGKRLYKAVKQRFPDELRDRMFRPTYVDEQTAELGLEMEHQRAEAEKSKKKTTNQKKKIAKGGFKPSPIAERRKEQEKAASKDSEVLEMLRNL
ncbi:hypothetical protein P4E94_14835 [Pontiellaceae bacterium B12219]|nr:hypothetical protein [Pontiellaceae bacterium B12219]